MITGFLLALFSTFFDEVSSSIGKKEVLEKKESIYTMGFLNIFWALLFFAFIIVFVKQEFLFSLSSLPTFIPRAILELAQAHFTILAIVYAERGVFGFIRTGPFLLY